MQMYLRKEGMDNIIQLLKCFLKDMYLSWYIIHSNKNLLSWWNSIFWIAIAVNDVANWSPNNFSKPTLNSLKV